MSPIIGHLIGAFEIPLTPGVIIDVWMATIPLSIMSIHHPSSPVQSPTHSKGSGLDTKQETSNGNITSELSADTEYRYYWATTPIDSVPFAVLQRMYVVSVSNWGVQNVVQVDLFGRHPSKGHLLMESVTSTAE